MNAEALARMFHENYEALAPQFGYKTREASAKPWADVPEQNKALMIAVSQNVLAALCDTEQLRSCERCDEIKPTVRVPTGVAAVYLCGECVGLKLFLAVE